MAHSAVNRTGYIEKWDQTGSPEIPDKGETSEIPGLPSGAAQAKPSSCTAVTLHTSCHAFKRHFPQIFTVKQPACT